MSTQPKVTFAIPTYGDRPYSFWGPVVNVMQEWTRQGFDVTLRTPVSAMPDHSKNNLLHEMGWDKDIPNRTLTSHNRNDLSEQFEQSGDEWIMWWDHDTVPQSDVLPRLLAMGRPFVSGAYYHRNDPHLPLMYRQTAAGLFKAISDFEEGAILDVDAVGMGCALIHREVYDAIRREYVVLQRSNGTLFLMHHDDIQRGTLPRRFQPERTLVYGEGGAMYFVEAVGYPPTQHLKTLRYPYYEMEHGRTEDMGFCEKARRCGYTITVDTSIHTDHWHLTAITNQHFQRKRLEAKVTGKMSPVILPSEADHA